MITWRINLKTKETSDEELRMIKKYCFKEGYIAMGWRIDELENPTLEEYISAVDKRKWGGGYKRAAEYIKEEMTIGSYCFARDNTNYYVGKITSDCYYASEDKHREYFFSWYRKIDWKKIGKQDETPGIIVGFLSHQRQAAIDKRNNKDLHDMVKFVYKKLSGHEIKKTENRLTKDNFTNLLYYETLEDLVGLYLQEKYNYLMIPKSGKINTPEFEYILILKLQ